MRIQDLCVCGEGGGGRAEGARFCQKRAGESRRRQKFEPPPPDPHLDYIEISVLRLSQGNQ